MLTYRRIFLIIIIALGAGLRLYDLGGQSFWLDEGWSAYMGYLADWKAFQVHEHPPLFYALVAAGMRIRETDVW